MENLPVKKTTQNLQFPQKKEVLSNKIKKNLETLKEYIGIINTEGVPLYSHFQGLALKNIRAAIKNAEDPTLSNDEMKKEVGESFAKAIEGFKEKELSKPIKRAINNLLDELGIEKKQITTVNVQGHEYKYPLDDVKDNVKEIVSRSINQDSNQSPKTTENHKVAIQEKLGESAKKTDDLSFSNINEKTLSKTIINKDSHIYKLTEELVDGEKNLHKRLEQTMNLCNEVLKEEKKIDNNIKIDTDVEKFINILNTMFGKPVENNKSIGIHSQFTKELNKCKNKDYIDPNKLLNVFKSDIYKNYKTLTFEYFDLKSAVEKKTENALMKKIDDKLLKNSGRTFSADRMELIQRFIRYQSLAEQMEKKSQSTDFKEHFAEINEITKNAVCERDKIEAEKEDKKFIKNFKENLSLYKKGKINIENKKCKIDIKTAKEMIKKINKADNTLSNEIGKISVEKNLIENKKYSRTQKELKRLKKLNKKFNNLTQTREEMANFSINCKTFVIYSRKINETKILTKITTELKKKNYGKFDKKEIKNLKSVNKKFKKIEKKILANPMRTEKYARIIKQFPEALQQKVYDVVNNELNGKIEKGHFLTLQKACEPNQSPFETIVQSRAGIDSALNELKPNKEK